MGAALGYPPRKREVDEARFAFKSVLARSEATKQSSLRFLALDCFAPLAMTRKLPLAHADALAECAHFAEGDFLQRFARHRIGFGAALGEIARHGQPLDRRGAEPAGLRLDDDRRIGHSP